MKNISDPDKVLKWSYGMAREWVIENLVPKGVSSSRKFVTYKKSGGYLPRHFPKSPDDYFRNRNTWKGWKDFLGNPDQSRTKQYVDYDRAALLCRQNGIRNSSDYRNWKDRPYTLPPRPDQFYKGKWKGWKDFLGNLYHIPKHRNYCKLSTEDVKIIRHQLGLGVPGATLAKFFKVSEMQISRIKRGENWGDIDVEEE